MPAKNHIARRGGPARLTFAALLALLTLTTLSALLALGGMAGRASAYSAGCGQIPIVYGIPPWGFHTGSPDGEGGGYARGHGDINLGARTVSGIICQELHPRDRPLCACPCPDVAEHTTMEREHEPIVEDARRSEDARLPVRPGERLRDVLELDLVEVGAGGHEVWDETLQILHLDRCGPGGLWTDAPHIEAGQRRLVGRDGGHCSGLDRLRCVLQSLPLARSCCA